MIKPLLLAATLALAALPAAAQTARQSWEDKGIKPLSGDKLKAFVVGNTLYHINPANGFRVPLYYVPDGTRYVRIRGQVLKTSWRIEREMVCEESVVLKREVCRTLYKPEGPGAICDEGDSQCAFGLDWAPGNAEGLGN